MKRAASPLDGGVMFKHWRDVPKAWWRWENFEPWEFACRRTGEFYYHPPTFDAIQASRSALARVHKINSGHRSRFHNALIRGAPRSAHLKIAVDVSTDNHDRLTLYCSLRRYGFTSFGLYLRFIHADRRLGRLWYGSKAAKQIWEPIVQQSKIVMRNAA